MRWEPHVARLEEKTACGLLIEKPDRKRPQGRSTHMWVDNIKMDLVEIIWDGVGWPGLAWLRISASGWML
jgi:hypothetical protein